MAEAPPKELMETDREGKNKLAALGIKTLEAGGEHGYDTNRTSGLPEEKVGGLQQMHGLNKLTGDDKEPIWKMFLDEFKSFVVIMLIVAAAICMVLRVWYDGVAIFVIIFLNASLGTYMSNSASNALEALASMAAPTCNVIRSGKESNIPAEELVPGDIVVLKNGDQVPADLRMFELNELQADEAPLTGESEPVNKELAPEDVDAPFAHNMCFASTLIVNGQGRGMVVRTGMTTEVGKIAAGVREKKSATPLQMSLDRLGGYIGAGASAVLVGVIIFAWLVDYNDPAHPYYAKYMKLLLMGVTFAVSSIPEGLPMVVTICLSVGCMDMVKRKAQVRKLPAVETLGSCSVVCSDKTGTLTEGKMTLVKLCTFLRPTPGAAGKDEANTENAQQFSSWPQKGFNPNGGFFDTAALTKDCQDSILQKYESGDVTVHRPQQSYDDVLADYGDPHGSAAGTGKAQLVRSTMLAAWLNSYETKYYYDPENKLFKCKGNMSEAALVVGASKCRWAQDDDQLRDSYSRFAELEVPFNSSRKMMATVHKLPEAGSFNGIGLRKPGVYRRRPSRDNLGDTQKAPADGELGPDPAVTHVAIVKGAPDKLFPWISYMICEKEGALQLDASEAMSDNEMLEVSQQNLGFAEHALRCLACCIVPLTDGDMLQAKTLKDATERLDFFIGALGEEPGRTSHQGKLALLGLMGSVDPPRAGVQEAVHKCRDAGVRVIMITGDQKITACAIAKNISILNHGDTVEEKAIACADLHYDNGDMLEDHLLDEITSRVNVFSRAQPEDKMAIVGSLQRQGHVVAMTGDGVNDAPALKKADIGVGMGRTGTDVAKGASDMVLEDDDFCTIVNAIEEGRKIYANIQKFVCFLLGTNIGEIFYLSIAVLANLPLPVFGIQVLFLNLFTDGGPAVALTMEPADRENMKRPPRDKKENIMTWDCMMWINMPHQCGITAMVIGVTVCAMYMHTGMFQQTEIETLCEYMTDASWENWDSKKCVDPSSCAYYCMCKSWDGAAWTTIESGAESKPFAISGNGDIDDSWIPNNRPKIEFTSHFNGGKSITHIEQAEGWTWDEWASRQRYETRFTDENPLPWPISTIAQTVGDRIHVSKGVQIVPGLIGVDSPDESHPYYQDFVDFKKKAKKLDKKENCMATGLTLGRSTSFITAVMCEMLRAYTVRSIEPAVYVFNRNKWMHFACAFSFTFTLLLTIIPGVKEIFYLDTPRWFYYFIAFIFAFGCACNDELFKFIYRRTLRSRVQGDFRKMDEAATKQRVETVVEMLHQLKSDVDLNAEHTVENRNAIGRVKHEVVEILETRPGMSV
jgi:magnesium-transporting ATPase (P-type)